MDGTAPMQQINALQVSYEEFFSGNQMLLSITI